MASEADAIAADDTEALKRDVAMYDQEEDAIDAFMGSASSLSASESDQPNAMAFGNREEEYSETPTPSSSVPAAAAQNARNIDANTEEANQHDANNSSSEMAFNPADGSDSALNPADGSDSAFNFPFPSMNSNQSEELFREQVNELCSESHTPHPHPQQHIPSDRETEEFNQLMKASQYPAFQGEQSMELEVRGPDQRQQQQQQSMSQLELQYAGSSSKDVDPRSPAPDSRLNYPSPTRQQDPQTQDPSDDDNNRDDTHDDTATSPPPPKQYQQQKHPKASARPSKTTAKPSSTAASGSKRAAPSPAAASASAAASDSSAQPFSWNDILRVQNMIERCLQQYLSKNEILLTLKDQVQVDPEFTSVVWQKLEEQNPSFFRAYNTQLQLKEQILAFNYLVTQQKEMMMMHRSMPHAQAAASTAALSSSVAPSLSVDSRAFIHSQQHPSSAGASSQSTQQQPSGSAQPASSMSAQFNMPPPSPLPLPSPIKTDFDTHAFFT